MDNRFRKKPLSVEAVQWFKMGDHPNVVKMLDTVEGQEAHTDEMADAWGKLATVFYAVRTREGNLQVNPGDWIVSDGNGHHYPCKPDAFAMTYEPDTATADEPSVAVVRIPAQNGLDPISLYLEDYAPGSGRITVACFGDSWTAAWSAMGDRTVQQFVASVDAGYLSGSFLQLCGGNGRHRIYTDRIARAIIAHLAPTQPEDRSDG